VSTKSPKPAVPNGTGPSGLGKARATRAVQFMEGLLVPAEELLAKLDG
jgi:hypothetical protein